MILIIFVLLTIFSFMTEHCLVLLIDFVFPKIYLYCYDYYLLYYTILYDILFVSYFLLIFSFAMKMLVVRIILDAFPIYASSLSFI